MPVSVRMRRSPAIAERGDVLLVAQSLAGFTAPLVCLRARVRMLVFVNEIIPKPGETAGAWWDATGAAGVRRKAAERRGYAAEFDLATDFLHDVPEDVLRAGPLQPREEAEIVFGESCRFELWPDIPIYLLAGRDDRFFPIEFNGVLHVKGSARRWRKFVAAICWRCQIRKG